MKFLIEQDTANERLDITLAKLLPEHSRSYLQKLIKNGAVTVDNIVITSPRTIIKNNSRLNIDIPEATSDPQIVAEEFDFPILFEDEHLLVIDKPYGVIVHPGAGNPTGTVVNALIGRYPEMANDFDETLTNRPGIVHRLDKDTSGALIVAKTPSAQFKLSDAFAKRKVHKTYLALVRGVPRSSGRIETLIGRHVANRQKMAVVTRNGKEAITLYRTIDSGVIGKMPYALLEVDILTGRTHQIRVHLSHLGHPVLGDSTYGGTSVDCGAERQQLHAWRVIFPHPATGEEMTICAPLPADMTNWVNALAKGKKYVP